jgi:hypothetical protein
LNWCSFSKLVFQVNSRWEALTNFEETSKEAT